MLFLIFKIGNDRYALDAGRVVEVVPLLSMKEMPQAPTGFAGIFNYRGKPVPAVDLCQLTLGRPAREQLSTRIIVLSHVEPDGRTRLMGLIAEHATEILRRNETDFQDTGITLPAAPYLGPVLMDGQGAIQRLYEQHLLTDSVRTALLESVPETAA